MCFCMHFTIQRVSGTVCDMFTYFHDAMATASYCTAQVVSIRHPILPFTKKAFSLATPTTTLKVLYDASDNLESVRLTPSSRRSLAEEENDAATIGARRLDFDDCTECEDAWVSLCAGVSSICDLVDFGSPLSTAAAASVATTCETFGSACSSYDASEACEGQCPDEGTHHTSTRGFLWNEV